MLGTYPVWRVRVIGSSFDQSKLNGNKVSFLEQILEPKLEFIFFEEPDSGFHLCVEIEPEPRI